MVRLRQHDGGKHGNKHKSVQMIRLLPVNLIFTFVPLVCLCQKKHFEIFGTITGNYNSKMYVFFEGNFRQRDSLSSEIINGKFHLKGNVSMPILARLHLDQDSYIG